MNAKFRNAIDGKIQACPPVWMMRQAGRYHNHYQKLRAKHSFMELCKNPDLAAEVALGPIQDFDFDVAILFSDLLFPLEALGMGLEYSESGPELGFHLNRDSILRLKTVDQAIKGLKFQGEAMAKTREKIPAEKSVIGFVGGPWTLYVYAVEGGHSGSLIQSKTQPELYHQFEEILLPLLMKNIQIQFDGGAEVVMIFDTAAGEVSPQMFQLQLQPALGQLAKKFSGRLGYYSKGTQPAHFNDDFRRLPWAGCGFDHRWDFAQTLKQRVGLGFTQGNFDQSLLHLPEKAFKKELDQWLRPFTELTPAERAGWVCGLGHGVLPKTPEENVRHFVRALREVFR